MTLPAQHHAVPCEDPVTYGMRQFIKGFITGQATLGLLVFFVVKVFLFKNGQEARSELQKSKQRKLLEPKLRPSLPRQATEHHVLSKIGYNVQTHAPETCDWLNVLVAQAITKYRTDPGFNNRIVTILDDVFNGHLHPGVLGPVHITEFSLGEEFPVITSSSMRFAEHLRAEVNFEFHDQITLGIDTQVLVNWPKPCIAALPVSLSVSVVRFSGTLAIEFVESPPDTLTPETYISFSILDDFELAFDIHSLLGHRTKVKDLPKLTAMITTKLRNVFAAEIVYPMFKKMRVPMLWGDAREEEAVAEVREELETLVEELKRVPAREFTM